MSFMDKLKAMFSGGSDAHDHSHDGHDHSHEGHDHGVAVDDLPPAAAAPLDPLGTSMPEAGPVPTTLPAEDDENA